MLIQYKQWDFWQDFFDKEAYVQVDWLHYFILFFYDAQDFIISNLREQAIFYTLVILTFYFHQLLGLLRATEIGFLLKLLIILLYFQVRLYISCNKKYTVRSLFARLSKGNVLSYLRLILLKQQTHTHVFLLD